MSAAARSRRCSRGSPSLLHTIPDLNLMNQTTVTTKLKAGRAAPATAKGTSAVGIGVGRRLTTRPVSMPGAKLKIPASARIGPMLRFFKAHNQKKAQHGRRNPNARSAGHRKVAAHEPSCETIIAIMPTTVKKDTSGCASVDMTTCDVLMMDAPRADALQVLQARRRYKR